jgi:DNA-binding transcriptional MerR regulator
VARRRQEQLYTLSEVAARTGISLASLRRYRAEQADRIPSVGAGRQQRFPEAALAAFQALKEEGMARRGRKRGAASSAGADGEPAAGGRKQRGGARARRGGGASRKPPRRARARKGAAAAAARDELLTLVQVGRMTGISYPTLLRYVRLHLDRLPHTGSGRKRRFRPGAVAVFQQLRGESRRGRRAGTRPAPGAPPSLARDLARLERGQRELARALRDLRKEIRRPMRVRLER